MIKEIKNTLKKSDRIIFLYHYMRNLYYKYFFTDKRFIKKQFKKHLGREVNLNTPVEFSDKLQWLKLYWYNSLAVKCADKYEVRAIVEKKIGSQYLNELYAVFNSVEEIKIEKLPNSFILKATHSSGYNLVCRDKNLIDWNDQLKKIKRWFKINYFWSTREWVYKDIKPRVICEKLLCEENGYGSLTDYKIYCFNGQPMYCQVIKDRESGGTIDFFDKDWNHMEFTGLQKLPRSTEKIPRPKKYDEMLRISKMLSQDFPFVRVDLYYINHRIYFGELTFFPRSGFGSFFPSEWNTKIGNLLKLPQKY